MEEPRITMTTKNVYKCLLEGDRFEIDVTGTTNEDLGALLTAIDKAALYSRVKQYNLNEQISSELIQGTISKCPVTLCACHRERFKRYGFYGDQIERIQVPEGTEFIHTTPRRSSTDEYETEEDGVIIRLPPNA
ncbi:unnamed protein product [Rodentolepis nana]|uniref:Elongin-C n=1 Tax=Rodentolepis nana TaxID=102285 RepID=A0A0R3TQ84_RODNA|nr:unnamed protein product [Rodentolepis nana]